MRELGGEGIIIVVVQIRESMKVDNDEEYLTGL
jgi:hypothetical protein